MVIHKFGLIVLFLIILGSIAVPEAKADPLSFSNVVALQNNGTSRVDLFSAPGVTLIGPSLTFLVDITGVLPTGVTNTLLVTYNELGHAPISQSFLIPAFGTIPPPFTQLFTINSTAATLSTIGATLTVDIVGSSPDFVIPTGQNAGHRVDSATYSFNVAQPVPEPATLLLFGTGLSGVMAGLRRRWRQG